MKLELPKVGEVWYRALPSNLFYWKVQKIDRYITYKSTEGSRAKDCIAEDLSYWLYAQLINSKFMKVK